MSLSKREIEDLKPEIGRIVEKVLGFSESTLVTAALNCLDKGYDKSKAERKLDSILEGSKLRKFCSKLYSMYDDYRIQTRKHHDRSHSSSTSSSSRKRKDESYEERDDHAKKSKKENLSVSDIPVGTPSPGQLTADKIKEVMATAQKEILERKAQLNIPAAPAPPSAQQLLLEKQRKMADLQASIAARMARSALPNMPAMPNAELDPNAVANAAQKVATPATKPTPLILDEQGRTIDATTGEAVQLSHHMPTLKANIRAKRREEFKQQLQEKPPEEISESRFYDTRVGLKPAVKARRKFKFHEKGRFEMEAARMRTKAKLEKLQNEIAQTSKKTGIASAAKLAIISTKKEVGPTGPV